MELRRSDDQVLAGVCAGLAEELGVEVMVFRTLYAASLVLFGLGIPLYVGLHLAMEPPAEHGRSRRIGSAPA